MTKLLFISLTYLFFWPTILCFGLTLFRFKLKRLIPQILISSLLLVNVSLWLQATDLVYLLSLIQFLSAFVCLWLIFKIPVKYSFLMMLITYVCSFAIEGISTFLIPYLFVQFVTNQNMIQFFYGGIIYCSIVWIITLMIKKWRLGFSFIPLSGDVQHIQFKGTSSIKYALIIGFFVTLGTSLCYFLYPAALTAFTIVTFIPLVMLLRISYKWELSE